MNVADGAWHHVVAVAGSDGSALHVDGQLDATGAAVSSIPVNTDSVTIGSQSNIGLYRWKGSLDEIALFNIALTAQQVADLYMAAGGQPINFTLSTAPGAGGSISGGGTYPHKH